MSHTEIAAFVAEKNSAKPELVPIAAQTMPGDGLELPRFPLALSVATFVLRAHWKRGFLFWMRFFAHPIVTLRWWRFLSRFSATQKLPPPHDELLQKPLSKFLVGKISYARRLDFLMENFVIASGCFSEEVMAALWTGKTIEVGSVHGRAGEYRCTLALADLCGGRHEGAFAVRLIRTSDDVTLWTTKFIFVARDAGGNRTIAVGGMQGPRAAKQEMVAVTRDLAGLRPKDAVLMLLQGLIQEDAGSYFAVSHARHPINYRRARRQKMLLSDIDAFWRERSAEPDDMFGFQVPVSSLEGADKRSKMKLAFFAMADRLCEGKTADVAKS
ncbi:MULTISPECIES: DUF535 family protein [unclassified Rhizobium]|uniref:DUF535 family protein n=1 Tax=unclassified Rhizobium TaxID=2613769 RepID=UPI002479197A|nr:MULTISPECIES: DUF535 family protein [unclassified Rhizobium]MDH7804186.1 uncharacterized protein VirK/YbjX [Rhizobium sp. AN70]